MNRILLALLLVSLSSFSTRIQAAETGTETPAQRSARLEWWRDARFGMFIHWGLYSQAAGYWDGKPSDGAGEWLMNDVRIPISQYEKLAPEFDPVKFNADEWVKIAKAAGMKYLVITSKHHDGFCMFNTKATTYNIVDATPWHKDPLLALSKACRRQGVRFCVYYSIMDWHMPAQRPDNNDQEHPIHNPTSFVPDKKADYIQYIKTQLKELITQYHPGLIWFDGQWMKGWTGEDGRDLYAYLHSLDPALIVNDRVGGGAGDYETPEQRIPANGLGHEWETCMTMNGTWGFKRQDHDWKSTETLVRNLIDCASKGGNYLLNVGPTGEGLIPDASQERLKEVGEWMKINGDAIYGTSAGPFTRQLPWGRCTTKTSGKTTTLYLHVFHWPSDGVLLVPGLKNEVKFARLLAGGKKLAVQNREDGLAISVPSTAPDKISSTIVLKFQGAPEVAIMPLLQKYDGSVTLPASEARLHGSTFNYESGGPLDNIGSWMNPNDWADWEFKVEQPGKFTVSAIISSPAASPFELSTGGQTLRCTAPVTGDYVTFRPVTLGTIEIPAAGTVALAVHPIKDGWQPMNLKAVKLTPAGANK
jgi:alpha-L-fucosidase